MILYRQKAENDTSAGYIKSALPYKKIRGFIREILQ